MIFNRRVELILTKESKQIIDQQSKICNWLYNHILSILKNETHYKTISIKYLFFLMYEVKKSNTFLNTVNITSLSNVPFRLYKSISSKNKQVKEVNYNSWNARWFSLSYDKPLKDIKILNDNIRVKLGENEHGDPIIFEAKLKRNINIRQNDMIKNAIITKKYNHYYISICLERSNPSKKPINNYIAIDQNHKNFFVGVDNLGQSFEFKQLTTLFYFDKQIDNLKSKLSKCSKESKKVTINDSIITIPSKRYERLKGVLEYQYYNRQEQIKQACYTIANWIARNYDCVAIGSYVPSLDVATHKNMHRKMLNQSIIGYFKSVLLWVMKRSGKVAYVIDERNTTKQCCICKYESKKDPQMRVFTCINCKNTILRDINGCINIAKRAKLLSGTDYVSWHLDQFTYTVKWDVFKTNLSFTEKLN